MLPMVSSDVDVLVVHGDEGSHEEASERVSAVPGRDRAGSFQMTLANPSRRDNPRVGKEFVDCLKIASKRGKRYWRRTWRYIELGRIFMLIHLKWIKGPLSKKNNYT